MAGHHPECRRHGFSFGSPGEGCPYYIWRCDHLGTRFVVQIAGLHKGRSFIDYVEDMPGGETVVEAHSPDVGSEDHVYAMLVGKMARGIPPNPAWDS